MFKDLTIEEYLKKLSSDDATSGGGSLSAIIGAMGAGLGMMVGNITLGKKGYENVQSKMKNIVADLGFIQDKLMDSAEKDATNFGKLMEAYKMPKETENRAEIIEDALKEAALPAMDVVELCGQTIDIQVQVAKVGAQNAVSDAAMGAMVALSAMQGAALTVYMNTSAMKDNAQAKYIENQMKKAIEEYSDKANLLYAKVEKQLKK